MYTTPFGPIVDGVVIPDDPLTTLTQKGTSNTFAKFDVMFGLTESEAFHLFPASLGITFSVPNPLYIFTNFLQHTQGWKTKNYFRSENITWNQIWINQQALIQTNIFGKLQIPKISRMVKFNIGKKSQNWLFLPHKKGKEIVMDRVVVILSPKNDPIWLFVEICIIFLIHE